MRTHARCIFTIYGSIKCHVFFCSYASPPSTCPAVTPASSLPGIGWASLFCALCKLDIATIRIGEAAAVAIPSAAVNSPPVELNLADLLLADCFQHRLSRAFPYEGLRFLQLQKGGPLRREISKTSFCPAETRKLQVHHYAVALLAAAYFHALTHEIFVSLCRELCYFLMPLNTFIKTNNGKGCFSVRLIGHQDDSLTDRVSEDSPRILLRVSQHFFL